MKLVTVLAGAAAVAVVAAVSSTKGSSGAPVNLVGLGGGGATTTALPIRVPPQVNASPPSAIGDERNADVGRAWGTFFVNRDAQKHHELRVLRVAGDAGNADIGTGEVIADVYMTVVASADWQWSGQACGATRFKLTFRQGHLQRAELMLNASPDKPMPDCIKVRHVQEVMMASLAWVQRGPSVYVALDTRSGLNMLSPDRMGTRGPNGTASGYFAQDVDNKRHPQWDNDAVASGYVVLDASWIFTPTDTGGNPL